MSLVWFHCVYFGELKSGAGCGAIDKTELVLGVECSGHGPLPFWKIISFMKTKNENEAIGIKRMDETWRGGIGGERGGHGGL